MRQDSQKPLLTSKIKHPSIHLNPQSRDHEIRQYNRSFLHTPIIINRTFILLLGVIHISMMEAMFNDWASHYVGTCDLSFAVAKCPHGPNRQCADETSSFYMVDDDTSVHSLASTSSRRSVKFAENVVSNVVEVPRYIDNENRGDLFYSGVDIAQFKHEFKMERKQWWKKVSYSKGS